MFWRTAESAFDIAAQFAEMFKLWTFQKRFCMTEQFVVRDDLDSAIGSIFHHAADLILGIRFIFRHVMEHICPDAAVDADIEPFVAA